MALYFATLTLLIIAVLGVRAFFRGTVSPRLIYALWIAVVIRLCLPISLFEVDFLTVLAVNQENLPQEVILPADETGKEESSEEITEEILPEQVVPEVEYIMPDGYAPSVTMPTPVVTNPAPVVPAVPEFSYPETEITEETAEIITEPEPSRLPDKAGLGEYRQELERILVIVWICGAAVMAVWFTVTGTVFRYRLCRDRKLSGRIGHTKIYVSSSVGAPCLLGLIPGIYITPEADVNPSRELVVLHEHTHLCHLDHLWSFIRIAALCVHWFNPLVWTAAIVSKQDAELACDDAVCSKLEEEKRFEYARVLIETIPQKHRYATGLGSAPMKQRILRLTKRQKNHIICAFLAVVLIITAVGCSFVGLARPTFENIIEQKGFTILSQNLITVELKINMDEMPTYEELCGRHEDNSLFAGSEWKTDGITAAEKGMSRIMLKSTENLVTHEPRIDDKITLEFEIEHDFEDDKGTVLAVYYAETTDSGICRVHCWYADKMLHTENGGYYEAVELGHSDSRNAFSVRIPAEIYSELTGTVSFSIALNEIEYARGTEYREYGAEIFTEEELKAQFFDQWYEEVLNDEIDYQLLKKKAQFFSQYQKGEGHLAFCIDEYETRKIEIELNIEQLEILRKEEESIITNISAEVSDEAKEQLEAELAAKRAMADELNAEIAWLNERCSQLRVEGNEILAKMAEAAAWIEEYAPDADIEISGVEKLPLGHIERVQIGYSPIVYEITQDMSVAMLSDDLIASVFDSINVDGLEVFIFEGREGSTCAGYRKDGVPCKFLTMAYPDGVVAEYSLTEFEDILGHSGFVIEWGGAHKYRYYYTVSPVGEPNIFLPTSGEVHETDYDRDGIVEIIASETAYSKVYDLFFEEAGDEYGCVLEADLNSEKDKTGYLYKYDAEKGYFVFSYNKADGITVYHRYGIADGSRLTLSTPFEDIDFETDTPNENVEIKSPVEVTYMNIGRPVNTVLIPLSGADPRYQTYRYDDRFTVYVTCDLIADRNGELFNADSKIVAVDNEKGRIVLEYEIGDLYGYPSSSYGINCMYLYSAGLNDVGEYHMDFAYKIDFTGGSVTVSDGADEFDWYKQSQKIVYTSDGRTAAVMTDDSLWNDGGVDIRYPDGRVERILDSVYYNGETVSDINDVIGYTPEAFIDDTHLVYSIGGWEWRWGFGIYNLETGESWKSEKNYRVLGVHDGAVYAAYENDGRSDYGISKMEIWRITPDGEETMIAATHDVPEGVYQLGMDRYIAFVNGFWVFYETGHLDGWSSSDLPDDRIIGAQVMSADFSTVVLEFDFYFNWGIEGVPAVTENAVTISCPVVYESAPEEADTVAGVIYRCDDVYILDDTPIHGDYRVTFPNGTGDYRIRSCDVLLCDDGCDLTDVVSRALWGYAPAYRIDQYDEIEASDGWSYPGRQYHNIVPEEMAAEMVRQMTEGGAKQHEIDERLGNRRYIWLLDLGDNMHLFTVLEAASYRKEKPENENEIVNGIMKTVEVELNKYDSDAVFKKQLQEFDSESLWGYAVGDHVIWYRTLPGGSYMLYGQTERKFYELGLITSDMIWRGEEESMNTVLPIYAVETDEGYDLCLAYSIRPYYFVVKLKEEDNGYLTRVGIEDIERREAEENPAYKEVTVTIDSLAELEEYHNRHIISDRTFQFYSEFIGGTSHIPEFNTVRISDFKISFTVPVKYSTTYFTFTVESSGLETLPPGEYTREVVEALEIVLKDPNQVKTEDVFGDVEEVKKLRTFINGLYLWNTPTFGEGLSYPGVHNYICRYYGDGRVDYEEFKRIASAEFGVTDFNELHLEGFILADGTIVEGGIGGRSNCEVADVLKDGDVTTVVMQFYADVNSLLKSYKIGYKFGSDGKWLGYDILEDSAYEPFGLRFAADRAFDKTDEIKEDN